MSDGTGDLSGPEGFEAIVNAPMRGGEPSKRPHSVADILDGDGALRAIAASEAIAERALAKPLVLLATLLPALLGGCADFGHAELERDQLGYSRSLTESQKEQTLLNIVRLRYGDVPVFLNATQVIAGYQLQRNASVGTQIFPSAFLSTFANGTASVQLQQTPTFTFQPVGGKDFAESYIRPLSPTGLYPLTVGNLPIDVLLRLTATSVGTLRNVNAFAGEAGGGSAGFFQLLADLRALQLGGVLELRLSGEEPGSVKGTVSGNHLIFVFRAVGNRNLQRVEREVKQLVSIPQDVKEAEVVYGSAAVRPDQIAIVTRSILGILTAVAFDVEVPDADVATGLTVPSLTRRQDARRPSVVVRATQDRPANAFASVDFHDRWFSIDDADFDSKVAFGVLQLLISLAQTPQAAGAVVTVPAR